MTFRIRLTAVASTLALGALGVPLALTGSATAATAAPTISASTSALIVSAKNTRSVTITAHVVDPNGATGAMASWVPSSREARPGTPPTFVALSLVSGTATDGVWSLTLAPDLCFTLWTVQVSALEGAAPVASTNVTMLTLADAPDTTPPPGPIVGVTPVYVGKPGSSTDVTAAPATGVEFWTGLGARRAAGRPAAASRALS